jgi:hypothetical protein
VNCDVLPSPWEVTRHGKASPMERPTLEHFLNQVASLALTADEAGYHTLSLALLLIVRGSRHSRNVRRCLANTGAMLLDTVEEAARRPNETRPS